MSSPLGLHEVYRSVDAQVDIVAVHGLNGDAIRTWTAPKSGKFWLGDEDMLPATVKNSRVLTYGYDANVTAIFGKTSSDRILDHAHTLIAELSANRLENDAEKRPIIFICHSLGGIIVKSALAYAAGRSSKKVADYHNVFISTYGVLFLGTPHNGSKKAKLASSARRMVSALTPSRVIDTSGQLVDALEVDSETLQNITDIFIPLMSGLQIYFFWEQKPMNLGPTVDYVVGKESAAPSIPDTERAGLPYDHVGMTRFESPTAPGYSLVASTLKRYARDAPNSIRRRHLEAEERAKMRRRYLIEELEY